MVSAPPISAFAPVDNELHRVILKRDLHLTAKDLLPNESRLRACLALRVDQNKPFSVAYAENTDTVKAENICRCDNPHICPNCGPIIAEEKARELREDLTVWELAGYTTMAVVLTMQHTLNEPLAESDKRIDRAILKMFDGPDGREFKDKWHLVGRRRNPDVTVNPFSNGWHSHRNNIWFLERKPLFDDEIADFEAETKELWVKYCKIAGGYADYEHGAKVRAKNVFSMVDYIASKAAGCGGDGRPGVSGDGIQPGEWGVVEETTKHVAKDGGGSGKGLTPTGLLYAHMTEDAWLKDNAGESHLLPRDAAGRLFQEYAEVFKGKKFLDTSPGFRKKLKELKLQHAEPLTAALPDDERPEYGPEIYIGPNAFKMLIKLEMLQWLIFEVKRAKGDQKLVKSFLEGEGIYEVFYSDLDNEYPDWWYVPADTPEEEVKALAAARKQLNQDIKAYNAGAK